MVDVNEFKKMMQENDDSPPLLTLEEFFEGNTAEDSIAPNDYGYGRPSLDEIWSLMRELEKRPDVAWIRVELYEDTRIIECNGEEVLDLQGDCIVICTSLSRAEVETLARCEWLCSGGAEDWWTHPEEECVNLRCPAAPKGYRCYAIVWD